MVYLDYEMVEYYQVTYLRIKVNVPEDSDYVDIPLYKLAESLKPFMGNVDVQKD